MFTFLSIRFFFFFVQTLIFVGAGREGKFFTVTNSGERAIDMGVVCNCVENLIPPSSRTFILLFYYTFTLSVEIQDGQMYFLR